MSDLVGQRVGHFRIEERLGEGGMGVVYRATDEQLRRPVAIKVLSEATRDDEGHARFLREARSLAAITHANIASIYEVGEDSGRAYIVMEYVAGESLRQRIARGRLEVSDALAVARLVLLGVGEAHAKGIVHRDLKPDNVMITPVGDVKVLDFGLAKLRATGGDALREADTQVTKEVQILGTPGYMAPEQLDGAAVDARADVFAFGVMLYEMLTGARPFRGKGLLDLAAELDRGAPDPIRQCNPAVSRDLERFVARCLARAATARFADATEALAALPGLKAPGSSMAASTGRAGLLLLVFAIAAAVVVRWSTSTPTATPATTSPSTSATVRATPARAITDWSPPKTSAPEAARAYAAGLQALRDGSVAAFEKEIGLALASDGRLAAAHLRVALETLSLEDARKHLSDAVRGRSSLDERDQRLLDFAQEILVDAISAADVRQAAHSLAQALPDDPEALFWAAHAIILGHGVPWRPVRDPDVAEMLDHALELDPRFAATLFLQALLAQIAGDAEAVLAAADACIAIAPNAASCLRRRAEAHGVRGECDSLEQDARRLITIEPDNPQNYGYLWEALASKGVSPDALADIAKRGEAVAHPADSARELELEDAARLDVYQGDFASAERALLELDRAVSLRVDEYGHIATMQLLALYEEEGDVRSGILVAKEYLRRLPAWVDGGPNITRGLAVATLRRAGSLLSAQANDTTEVWLAKWRPRLEGTVHATWFDLYGSVARTPLEARDALAALPDYVPLPPATMAGCGRFLGDLGRVYALAGETDAALPLLRSAVRSCANVPSGKDIPSILPFGVVRDRLALGQILEQTPDRGGACEEYGAILARWGRAKPRSVTADKARERSRALGCP
jgi:eukaryotic-like serine/threonine-protein kinase